ncbi:hypothetical protein VKT23_007977 [Stygiomarasmius scandens]|uniref:F-box domain-containing protein n=1 Tax=Marasmiellus scandens TaxID=2682957 RepID=A0ABR1JIY2_9AGAR
MTTTIHDLPKELVQEILIYHCDPLEVGSLSQCSKFFYELISEDRHLWRELYLAQGLDDPEKCVSLIGRPRLEPFDWKEELQAIIRARTILGDVSLCKPHERCGVLKTLLKLVSWVPPLRYPEDKENTSMNLLWVVAVTRGGNFVDSKKIPWEQEQEEKQLRARLHTMLGVVPGDLAKDVILWAREMVYRMDNYTWGNEFGPFRGDGEGRVVVDWVHLKAVHHTISMRLIPPISEEEADFEMLIYPLSAPSTQAVIPESVVDLDLDKVEDWAGVGGVWMLSFCFVDHRLLIRYNESEPGDNTFITDPNFRELFRTLEVKLHVTRTVPDKKHPGRPQIYFVGVMAAPSTSIMNGYVKLTDDDQIRWHFVCGESGNAIWRCGSVSSPGNMELTLLI